MSNLMDLDLMQEDPFKQLPDSICWGCKHFFTDTEQDGWENPEYTIQCCDAVDEEGKLVNEYGLDGWPIEKCSYFEKEE